MSNTESTPDKGVSSSSSSSSASSGSISENKDKTTNPSSLSSSSSSSFETIREKYYQFNLHETIDSTREGINSHILSNVVVHEVYKLGSQPAAWREDLEKQLSHYSETLNTRYPYFASLARTQETLLIAAVTVFVAIPASRIRRGFLPLTALAALNTKAVTSTFNYKWQSKSNATNLPEKDSK